MAAVFGLVRIALVCALAATTLAIAETSAAAAATLTSYSYTSQQGDYVGAGASNSYSTGTATIAVGGTAGAVHFTVTTSTENWEVDLAAPAGQQLRPGAYSNAARAGFNGAQPGLAVFGDGRGCNNDTGSFVLDSIEADAAGTVDELEATFTQFCGSSTAALSGTLDYQAPAAAAVQLTSSNPSTVRGEPTTLTARVALGSSGLVVFQDGSATLGSAAVDGNGLASITTSALTTGTHTLTASSGNTTTSAPITQSVAGDTTSYWFASVSGDYVGAGATAGYSAPSASVTISGSLSYLTVSVGTPTENWSIVLAAAPGQALAPGSYTGAQRAEFRAAGAPGIDVTGDGRGCNTDAGSFTINSIAGNPSGAVMMLDAAFTQYCDSSSYPLTGVVKVAARAPSSIVISAPASASAAQAIAITATVTGASGPATGTVGFTDGSTTLGSASLNTTGTATLSVVLAPGSHTITARYLGDANYTGSSAATTVSVSDYPTTTTLSAPASSVKHGRPVTFTATVAGGSTPTGAVTILDGSTAVGTASLADGTASFTWSASTRGTHTFTATYGGDASHQPSTSNSVSIKVS